MDIKVNLRLERVKDHKSGTIIKVDGVRKTAIIEFDDETNDIYSWSTFKDKRKFIPVDETPEPEVSSEIVEEVPEERHLVPMPGAERLADLKKEYSKEEKSRKPRITITYNGEEKTPKEWATQFGMDAKKIRLELRRGKTPEEIFSGKNK